MFAKSQGISDIEVSKDGLELFMGPGYLMNYAIINGVKVHIQGTMESSYAAEKRSVIELENRTE